MKASIETKDELVLKDLNYTLVLEDNKSNILTINTIGSTFTIELDVDPLTQTLMGEINLSNITKAELEFKNI